MQPDVNDVEESPKRDDSQPREPIDSSAISEIRNFKLEEALKEVVLSSSKSSQPYRIVSNRPEERTALSPVYKDEKSLTSLGDTTRFHNSIKSIPFNRMNINHIHADRSGDAELRDRKGSPLKVGKYIHI